MFPSAKLHQALKVLGFSFSPGLHHQDVAREEPSVRNQRKNFIDTVRTYRQSRRTIYYRDETWLNNNMTSYRM